jgi:hypothetical protein
MGMRHFASMCLFLILLVSMMDGGRSLQLLVKENNTPKEELSAAATSSA